MSLAARLTALAQAVGADIKDLRSKLSSATISLDPWHYVGTPGEPPFLNAWQNRLDVPNQLKFRKDPFGVVHISGTIQSGISGAPIFNLPAGYFPKDVVYGPTLTDGGAAGSYLFVNPDGSVWGQRNGTTLFINDFEFDTRTVTTLAIYGPKGDKGAPGDVSVITTLDWNTALVPGLYRSSNDWMAQTTNGPGDQLNPPAQAGIVTVHENGALVQRVWDLDTKRGYTRYRSNVGTWSAWAAELVKPPLLTEQTISQVSPEDGDERYFQTPAMKTSGFMWKFRYDKTAPSGKGKWVFVGGTPWFVDAPTAASTVSGGTTVLGDMQFTLPLGGDYMIEHGARLYNSSAPAYGEVGQLIKQLRGGGLVAQIAVIDFWTAQNPNLAGSGISITPHLSKAALLEAALAGDVIQPNLTSSGASAISESRWIKITPIRVVM